MSFSGGDGGRHHARAHPAPAFGLADQPPAKRMRTTAVNSFQNDAAAAAAQPRAGSASSTSPFPFSSPPFQQLTSDKQHSHPSFLISPDRDCKFGAFGGADQYAPIAQHSNISSGGCGTNNLNSPAPAAALWFGATPAPTADSGGLQSGTVMQITQDSISDIDEPPPSMHESKQQTPREWWKQRPAAGAGTGAGTSAAAPSSSLSASSSFSSLAPQGAAVAAVSGTTRCHVCNVNEAPPLQSSDVEVYSGGAGACAGTGAHHQTSHLNGSPFVANGIRHHSPAFHSAGHRQHADYHNQQQHMPQTPASTRAVTANAAAGAPVRQKNSLLSYFQVRKPPAVCSTPSRPASFPSSSGANSSTPHSQTHSAHPSNASVGPSVLTCSYCERPSCPSCTRHCQSCSKRYCTFCSTVNYDESREERVFCLDCHHDAHAVAIGTVAETSHGGCMDMEE